MIHTVRCRTRTITAMTPQMPSALPTTIEARVGAARAVADGAVLDLARDLVEADEQHEEGEEHERALEEEVEDGGASDEVLGDGLARRTARQVLLEELALDLVGDPVDAGASAASGR